MKKLQVILLAGLLIATNSVVFGQEKSIKGGAADRGVIGKVRVDTVVRPSTGVKDSVIVKYNAQGQPEYDTFGKCDEQYYSAIQLTLKREKAVAFTIQGTSKVEFSSGNLQYCQKTKTFRFAERQWYFCGDGSSNALDPQRGTNADANSSMEIYDSVWIARYVDCVRHVDKLAQNGTTVISAAGTQDSVVAIDTSKKAYCTNTRIGDPTYQGWIDLFGWATSGFNRAKEFPNNVDLTTVCFLPYATSVGAGYGPNPANQVAHHNIDTTCVPERWYDWGQQNDIYCKWVGYDTFHVSEIPLVVKDTQVMDSTYFRAKNFDVQLVGGKGTVTTIKAPIWRTLTADEWTNLLKYQISGLDGGSVVRWSRVNITKLPSRIDPTTNNERTVTGILLYPDGASVGSWKKGIDEDPLHGVVGEKLSAGFNVTFGNSTISNITYADFCVLEKQGVVFLPLGGQRTGSGVGSLGTTVKGTAASRIGNYWSATSVTADNAKSVSSATMTVVDADPRSTGNAVRLVHDIADPINLTPSIYYRSNANHKGVRNITYTRLHP